MTEPLSFIRTVLAGTFSGLLAIIAEVPGRIRGVRLLVPILVSASFSHAATYTWDGGGTTDNWSDAANWNNAISSGNALTFAGSTRLTPNNDQTSFSVTNLTFNNSSGAFILSGNAFNISNSLTNNDSDTQTINNALTISASQSWDAGSGSIIINGTVGLSTTSTARTLTFNGDDPNFGVTVNGNIDNGVAATGNLTKSRAGFLTLAGNNTYSGTTTLNDGTLNINSNTALGTSAFALDGGTIDNTSGATRTLTNNNVITLGGNVTFTGTNDLNLGTGAFSLGGGTRTFTINGNILTVGGVVDDGGGTRGVTKTGTGTLELTGANLYGGVTTVTAGTLLVNNLANGSSASSLGNSSNAASNLVLNGGTLKYSGAGSSSDRLFTLTTGGAAGTIDASGTGAVNFTNTGNMAFSGNGTRTLTLTGTNTADNTLATVIGDSGGNTTVIKTGTGTWVLSGMNTYNGVTGIGGGILSISSIKDGGIASNIGDSTNAAGNLIISGGTLKYTGAAQGTDRLFSIGTGDGAIDASGTGALNFTNTGSMGFYLSGTRTLTLAGTNTGANTLAAVIGDSGGATSLAKAGAGTWVLSGTNTYTGATTVSDGILNLQNSSALGSGTSGTTVSSGATLQLQGGIAVTSEVLTLSGTGSGSLGALDNLSGNNTVGTAASTYINLAADSRINSSAGTLTIAGNIGSSASNALTIGGAGDTTISGGIATGLGSTTTLTKDGAGTLILSGSNSYQGATNVTQGIVSVQHNFGLGATTTGANGTFVTSGAELQLSHATGITVGGESLSLAGAGVGGTSGALTNVLGNNTYGGLVTLTGDATIKSTADALTLAGGISSANHGLTVTGAGNVTVTDTIANGTGTLTKQGAGTFAFAGTTNGTAGTVGAVSLEAGGISVGNGTQTTTLNTGNFESDIGTTLTIASGGTVVSTYTGSGTFSGAMAGSGTFEKTGAGILVFDQTFTASNLTLKLSGGTLSLLGGAQITVGTIHITGNTILDFNNSAGTFLSSANVVINAGVTVTVNNWVTVANNAAQSTVWYATSTLNAGTLGGSDQVGGTPLGTGTPGQPGVVFTGITPGLTPTWVSGNHNGWFDHEIRPTPEPSTYGAILLSSSLALLGWRRWRRRIAPRA